MDNKYNILSNLIAYYGLLITILIPIVILLLESIKDSPGVDRRLLFKRLFPVKKLGLFLGGIVLPTIQSLIFSKSLDNEYTRMFLAAITATMTVGAFMLIYRMISWISSGENRDAFHNYYRQNIRIEFLNKGSIEEKDDKWFQFWTDEKVINYFDNDICPYIDVYFSLLKTIKSEEWDKIKKSSYAFAYRVNEIYKSSEKGVKIYAHTNRVYKMKLINTIPYCLIRNIEENIGCLKDDNIYIHTWYSYLIDMILKNIRKSDDSISVEWMESFNVFFFGMPKKKHEALMVLMAIMAVCREGTKKRRGVKKEFDIYIKKSDKKYVTFYRQLYMELEKIPDETKILGMIENGCSSKK